MVFSRTNTHAGQDWSERLGARPRSRDIPREKPKWQKHRVLARGLRRGLARVTGRGRQFLLHLLLGWFKASKLTFIDEDMDGDEKLRGFGITGVYKAAYENGEAFRGAFGER